MSLDVDYILPARVLIEATTAYIVPEIIHTQVAAPHEEAVIAHTED